ncbi:MAG: hypothetical protein ACOC35_07905 [Promethearchaeia archaeon]
MESQNEKEVEALVKNLGTAILDPQEKIIFKEVSLICAEGGIACKVLKEFLTTKDYQLNCTNVDDFFSALELLNQIIDFKFLIPHISCDNIEQLRNQLYCMDIPFYQQFFTKNADIFSIFHLIIQRYLAPFQIVLILSRFSNLKEILMKSSALTENQQQSLPVLPNLQKTLRMCIHHKDQKIYRASMQIIRNCRKIFPRLYKNIRHTYRINKYITLKLENGQTNIYVAGRVFNQCKFLFINLSMDKVREYDSIKSIDEAEDTLDNSLEGGGQYQYEISAETEFWGHCSNLEVWAEHNYDTRLLHRNLAFPLLKRLTEVGDPQAQQIFKEEILNRVLTGYPNVIRYLSQMGYFRYLRDINYEKVIQNSNMDIIENFLRVLGTRTRGVSSHIKRILARFQDLSNESFKEKISELLTDLDPQLYKGFRRSGFLKKMDRRIINEAMHDPTSNLKEFYYHFRGTPKFLTSKLSIRLPNENIQDITEIKGIHRLRYLKELNLNNNNISRIRGLEHLAHLEKLSLNDNPLPQSLLNRLGGLNDSGYANEPQKFVEYCKEHPLPEPEHVTINDHDYELLNGTLLLRNLEITALNEIEGLYKLKTLEHLDLCNNLLINLRGIERVPDLRILDVRNNYLKDITGVEKLDKLEVFRVHGNGIYDIEIADRLKRLKMIDLDTRRQIDERTYLGYLLESFTVKKMHGLCKVYQLRGYSKYIRADLINFIQMSPSRVKVREIIYSIESKVIFPGIRKAVTHIKQMRDMNEIQIQMPVKGQLSIEIHKKRKVMESRIKFTRNTLKDPERTCHCKVGGNQGFCSHFWYGFIFALKMKLFPLQDWTLTSLPKKLKSALSNIKVKQIGDTEYRFVTPNFLSWY